MQSKLYLSLVILFVFVICTISVDEKSRKSDFVSDLRKKLVILDEGDIHDEDKHGQEKEKHGNNRGGYGNERLGYGNDRNRYQNDNEEDEVDDYYPAQTSYANNRYTSSSPPEGNYRTRPRWPPSQLPAIQALPSPYDEFMNENEWSRFGFGNAFPGSSPSISFDNNPMLSSGPTCHSLVDGQYPIFSDLCGAVPQARYALPNAFGHRERWQIAQILPALMGASAEPGCTRSLRLLLCPVLFPPCPTRHEPPPVLPCQSYCRAVKSRCEIPALDLLPCEMLPFSSDLCPTTQPYGSFAPPGTFPSIPQQAGYPTSAQPIPFSSANQPFPMNGGMPSPNYPTARSNPFLQSLLSAQNRQSGSPPPFITSVQSVSPVNPFNNGQYAADSLSQMLADFPSQAYMNDYRQASRYAPYTRSSTETRPTTETRYPAATRSSAPSAAVKA